MLYSLYEMNHWAVAPFRAAAIAQSALLRSPLNPVAESDLVKAAAAASDVFESVTRRYRKPDWNLAATMVRSIPVAVKPKAVWTNAWCSLIHFQRDAEALQRARGDKTEPKVLLVAPLSGHYATLLRGTVEAFLPEHEVYITDWSDARMVPIMAGRFDMHDYIDYIAHMLRLLGPKTHVVAVCQPGPLVLAAAALMAESDDPCRPATMTFMGSPIDARKSPTVPNKLAEEREFAWFERNMIHTVPPIYPGAFRRVYPGFLQLASFMGMNWSRHVNAHRDYYEQLVKGDGETAQKHREFYDEYLSVLDLSEEFYLDTIKHVFQEYSLANGTLSHRGRLVRPEAIRDVALMTVEGENDDISGIGQTQAAHELCASIPEAMRQDYIQLGVGHYGVFNGKRFRTEIYPRMREFMRTFNGSSARARPKIAAVA
ncbi:MAG: polyhydroxyalkanoate depolymerase [Alphaproteobacteria bacterium]|nr:polyhydroxyalkanoate depolymerase [Alphaproteobacteria bacterium]